MWRPLAAHLKLNGNHINTRSENTQSIYRKVRRLASTQLTHDDADTSFKATNHRSQEASACPVRRC